MTIDAETMMLGAQLRTVLRGGLLAEPDVRLGIVANRYPDAEGNVVSYDVSVIGHDGTQVESVNIPGGSASYGIGQAVQLERVGGSALGYYRLAERIGPYGTETPALIGGTTTFTPTLITGLGFHIPKGDGCIIVGGTLVRDPNPRVTGTRVRICANGIKGLTDNGNGDRMAFMLATEDHTTFENDQPVSIGAGDAQLGYRDTGHLYVDSAGGSFAWRVGTQTLWQSQMVGDLPYTQMAGLLRLSDTYVGEGIEMGKDHRDAYIIQLLNKYGIPLILMRAGFDDDPNRAYIRFGPPPPHPNIEISSYPDGTPYIIMDGAALRPSSVTYNSLNILQISDISGNMGVLQAGRAEFLQPGTSFVHWLDLGNATGIVLGYDDQTQTGRVLGLDGGVIQTEMDGTGRILAGAGNVVLDAAGITLYTDDGTDQFMHWYSETEERDIAREYVYVNSGTSTMYHILDTLEPAGHDSLMRFHTGVRDTYIEIFGRFSSYSKITLYAQNSSGYYCVIPNGTLLVGLFPEPFPADTVTAYIRPTAAANAGLVIRQHDSAQTGALQRWENNDGTIVFGGISANGALTTKPQDAITNTHSVVATWGHNTSGTAAASFALRHLYQLESSTTADQDAAAFDVLWTTATHASRTAAMRWLLVNNAGALAEYMRLAPSLLTVTPESMFRNHLTLDDDSGASPELKWVAEDGSTVRAWKDNGGDFKFASNAGGIDFSGINGSFAIGSKNFSMGRDLTLAGGHDLHIYFDASSGADGTITMASTGMSFTTSGGDITFNPNGNVGVGSGGAVSGMKLAVHAGGTAALNLAGTSGTITSGIRFATDVDLYRSAANVLTTPDNFFINDDANAMMTQGITINQGGNDDEILAFKSSDVAHGVTDIAETDTYAKFLKGSGSAGGLLLRGFVETGVSQALHFDGIVTDGNTAKSTAALGPVVISGRKKSGTGTAAMGANENLLVVRDATSTRFLVDAEGDVHYDATTNASAWDAWDDVQLVRTLEHTIAPEQLVRNQFDAMLKYNRTHLIEAGILSDGGFVNLTQLQRLHSGAIWQMHTQMMELRQEIAALRERLN